MSAPTPFEPEKFWESRLSKQYDLQGVGYQSLGKGFNKWMYRVRKHLFNSTIEELFPAPATLEALDIGSGTGFYLTLLQNSGFVNITGSDLTETAVEQLADRFSSLEIKKADISATPIPFKVDSFDLITCMDVLFHIVDDHKYEKALSNCYELLKPGGFFIFTDNFAPQTIRKQHHVSRSKDTIMDLLDQKGFSVIKYSPMFYYLNEPSDPERKGLIRYWNVLTIFLRYFPFLGDSIGASLYKKELRKIKSEVDGPSTQFVVCRKA